MTTPDPGLFFRHIQLLHEVSAWLLQRRFRLSTAESCTGGLIAAMCTGLPGSSDWFEAGFVTYSVDAKVRLLGVSPALIDRCGVVSAEIAEAMATGALECCAADAAIAVTGVAGPSGGTTQLPTGTVWIGWALRSTAFRCSERFLFQGDRAAIREQAVIASLERVRHLP